MKFMQEDKQQNANQTAARNKLMTALILLGIVFFIFATNHILSAILGNFTSTFHGVRTGYTGSEDKGSFSANYLSLNGTIRKKITPKGNALHISVTTKSGTLTIEIRDAEDRVIFDAACSETEVYDVPVSGKVTILIKADNHNGNIEIQSEP